MAATKTSISIEKTLLNQAEVLAQQLTISRNHLFALALEQFMKDYPVEAAANQADKVETPVINQGDIYWVQLADTDIPHPHVVIQDNLFNHSRIRTVVACALTSNIKRASLPGTILLEAGEANLTRQSVVETSKVSSVDKTQLGAYIGSLTEERINQILAGVRFLQVSFFTR